MSIAPPVDPSHGVAAEAARQQALLAAITAPAGAGATLSHAAWRGTPAQVARGLAAYRANAHALAHRALAAALPTFETMVGADQLPALARAFWQAHPPRCGDIAEWGDALPDWLAEQPALAEWPWLPDAARLDLAVHRAERAADDPLDAASLGRLGDHDPAALRLLPAPGLALVTSAWPIVTMFHAHRALACGDADALDPVREALDAATAEAALVCRHGWRAEVTRLDPADQLFMRHVLAGHDLSVALDAAGPAFDFAGWLHRALAGAWLKGVAVRDD